MANTARVIADLERAELRVEQAEAERDEALERLAQAREALEWLVRLKDGPRNEKYELEKPHAWEQARYVLARLSSGSGEGGAE